MNAPQSPALLESTPKQTLYTAMAVQGSNRSRKRYGKSGIISMQLIKGDFNEAGKPLPKVVTRDVVKAKTSSKYIPHAGAKQQTKQAAKLAAKLKSNESNH